MNSISNNNESIQAVSKQKPLYAIHTKWAGPGVFIKHRPSQPHYSYIKQYIASKSFAPEKNNTLFFTRLKKSKETIFLADTRYYRTYLNHISGHNIQPEMIHNATLRCNAVGTMWKKIHTGTIIGKAKINKGVLGIIQY